jgi:hypothetical protein
MYVVFNSELLKSTTSSYGQIKMCPFITLEHIYLYFTFTNLLCSYPRFELWYLGMLWLSAVFHLWAARKCKILQLHHGLCIHELFSSLVYPITTTEAINGKMSKLTCPHNE